MSHFLSSYRVRDISNELEASKVKLRIAEDKLSRPSPHLIQLQNEMADMKVQHRLAIQLVRRHSCNIFPKIWQNNHKFRRVKTSFSTLILLRIVNVHRHLIYVSLTRIQEQRNSSEIKEAAQKLDASHEKRVSTLEARLAELSLTVGSYDRLRQEDLSTVSKLKVTRMPTAFID